MLKRLVLSTALILGICSTATASTDAGPMIVAIDSPASEAPAELEPAEEAPLPDDVVASATEGEGESDTSTAAGGLVAALRAGKWVAAIGFALLLIVGLARRLGGEWAKTKTGGYVLGFGLPIIGALGLAMTTGVWSLDLFIGALSAGLAASGLYTSSKDARKAAGA